jgi:MerR family transcriptional regulator, thiopeptide resistance regulator
MSARGHTVSQVARLAHVTVRTLHHYDEIGLLVPSDRSQAGYRLYSDAELARLREILLLRELGFGLDAIAELIEQPPAGRREALRAQRDRLVAQRRQVDAVLRAIDAALDALEGGPAMTSDEMFEGFDQFDHAGPFADEARERWGDTDAYKESTRRTRAYSKHDWAELGAESEAILVTFIELLDRGVSPDDAATVDAAERARLHIDRWFYPCSRAMHAALAEGYVSDPRFTAFYDNRRAGLAAFVAAAIRANRDRAADG